MKTGYNCPHCNEGVLEYYDEQEPWEPAHYMCTVCFSTFDLDWEEDNDVV